jgi:pSer/pThr/pTyr-binding forkhead associated (FHA) protein
VSESGAKLVVVQGDPSGKAFDLGKASIIGRHPEAQVRLKDVKVSREHSKLFMQGADYYIVDLNSRNGTLVNDARVTKRLLHHGDEILLGDTRFRFENPPPADETPPEVEVPKEKAPAYREVVDLQKKPTAAPAGAISADEIVLKERALQFQKIKGHKKPSLLFDDVGQRSFVYQLLIAVVVIAASIVFFIIALRLFGEVFA